MTEISRLRKSVLFLHGVGYVLAAAAASLVYAAIVSVPHLDPLRFLQIWLVIAAFAALFSWPGFLLVVWLAARNGWKSPWIFMAGGALNCLLAAEAMFWTVESEFIRLSPSWLALLALSGAAGGWTYWKWTYGFRAN